MKVGLISLVLVAMVALAPSKALAGPISAFPPPGCSPGPCTDSWYSISFSTTPTLGESFDTKATTLSQAASGTLTQIASDFGVNKVEVSGGLENQAQSLWADTFTISGGTGSDVATFDWSLDGSISVPGVVSGCSAPTSASYTFRTIGAGFGSTSLAFGSLPGCTTAQTASVDKSGSFNVTFQYGVPFAGGFTLLASNGESFGTVNLFNTGLVSGIILPPGATLQTGSGTEFPLEGAAPVPEAPTGVLFGLAVVLLAVTLKFRF
jgi:hypothetical protein